MDGHRDQATRIKDLLGLETPVVAVTFADDCPDGVLETSHVVPSTCAFWRLAETGVFYARAAQHFNCPVGSMVMGFELPDAIAGELGGLVETMCAGKYLSPEEGSAIPSVGRGSAGIVYGPLADLPVPADIALMWLTPRQAMVVNEASGAASWAAEPRRLGGRPGCAALPLALQDDRPTLSFGCIGMRTFTEIADDRMLAAVPGQRLGEFVDALETLVGANTSMQQFYESRRSAIIG